MEHAPLRPVPSGPRRPVDVDGAARVVERWLPEVDRAAAVALAGVAFGGLTRPDAAARAGLSAAELPAALARARKELRRTLAALPASGWCERAELLISDRLDGAIDETGTARLDAHLRNCPRCVEHERRLVQATDALTGAIPPTPTPTPRPPVPRLVARPPIPPVPKRAAPAKDRIEAEEAVAGEAAAREAAAREAAAREAAEREAAERQAAERAEREAAERAVPAAAGRARVAAGPRRGRQVVAAVGWNVLLVLAVLLAVASIALSVAGVLGAEL